MRLFQRANHLEDKGKLDAITMEMLFGIVSVPDNGGGEEGGNNDGNNGGGNDDNDGNNDGGNNDGGNNDGGNTDTEEPIVLPPLPPVNDNLGPNPAKVSGEMVLRSDLTYTILDMAHYGQWKGWVQKFHQKINDIEMYKLIRSLRAGNPPVKGWKSYL